MIQGQSLGTRGRSFFRWSLMGTIPALALAALLSPAFLWAEEDSVVEDTWSTLFLDDQRIGYEHRRAEKVTVDGKPAIRTEQTASMTIQRLGAKLSLTQRLICTERDDGSLVSFEHEVANPPAQPTKVRGNLTGEKLQLETVINGKPRTSTKTLPAGVKSPLYPDRWLRESPLKAKEKRTLTDIYAVELGAVAKIELVSKDWETIKLSGGERRLLKIEGKNSLMPGVTLTSWLDDTGEGWKTSMPMLGMTLHSYRASKAEAMKPLDGGELDFGFQSMVPVAGLERAREASSVVYHVRLPDRSPADSFAESLWQAHKKISDRELEITVTRPGDRPPTAQAKPTEDERGASQYLQTADEDVVKLAKQAAGKEADPEKLCRQLERFVYEKLNKKAESAFASAAEVARTLEGDCTEHAMLLAAMLRARGVPARVAVGLLYVDSRKAFGGHMWTEAYVNDRWICLDAANGHRFDCGYIKMAQADLADDGPTPEHTFAVPLAALVDLKIEVVKVVAP